MKLPGLILLSVALVALAACAYPGPRRAPGPGDATLVNTYWKLMSVDGVDVVTPTDRREAHFILRPDHRVAGFGSCNAFNGSWQQEGDRLVVGPLMATKMACPELEVERALFGALDGEIEVVITGETLRLTGRDGTEIVCEARYFG